MVRAAVQDGASGAAFLGKARFYARVSALTIFVSMLGKGFVY